MASLSFGKIPWQGQLGIFVAVSLAAAGAFYYYYEMPRQAAIATQSVELSAIRARISTGQATARQLPEFRAQVTELEARLDSLKPILPDERDAGDLLRRVQTLAVQSNLVIRGFRPQAISMKEMHAEWPISLQLEGTYHNLGLFLDRVSKFPRIINIGGLTLAQREGAGSGSTMTIACTATTFVLVEQPAAPAAAKGKKAPKKAPAKK
ncbi:MAG: type 4a pilus biogenesis protein PilO [Acidobacteriota bacterium]|nr:type 4a pilus biogenesis protein PilO [Acidobacteriota bacterium]